MILKSTFEEVKAAGGCVYGGGEKGQPSHPNLCRKQVAHNSLYCPIHTYMVEQKDHLNAIKPGSATRNARSAA